MKKLGLSILLATLAANAYADNLPESCQELQAVYNDFVAKDSEHWAIVESGDVMGMLEKYENNWSEMDDVEKDMASLRCESIAEMLKGEMR